MRRRAGPGRSGLAGTFAEFRGCRETGATEFYTKQPFKSEVIPGMEPKQRFDAPRKAFGGKGGGKGGRSDRGERGFGGPAKGWGQRDTGRQEPRFEARHDPRFESGPARDAGAFAPRGFGHPGERFERRDDRAPRSFDKPQHAPRAQARAGGNDRFVDRAGRGPKLVGGGFKPHAPKRRG